MLGLVLLYFIGKYYVDLAKQFSRNKWVYGILGIATYYGGTILFGFGLGAYSVLANNTQIMEMSDMVLGLIAIPFGLLTTWGLYAILKNSWKKSNKLEENELLDAEQSNF